MYILAIKHFLKLACEDERTVAHKPFKLMKYLDNIGYQSLEERTEKTLDYQLNRQRNHWAEFRSIQIPKVTPTSHSNGGEIADLVLLSAIELGIDVNYLSYVFMQNHWINNLDLSEGNGVWAILLAQGLNAKALLEKAYLQKTENLFEKNTAKAIGSSVFGSPTYFADGDMFYSKDKLQLVKRALRRPFK